MVLGAMGNLYNLVLERPEQAVVFFQRAAEINQALGDTVGEGRQLNNLANVLCRLQRFEEARAAITRAIQCMEAFGQAELGWSSWEILALIETEVGNPSAVAQARKQARGYYLAYRRDGGENQLFSGRIAMGLRQALAEGKQADAVSALQLLAVNPDFSNQLPFIDALNSIIAGSRDRSLVEDPRLSFDQAAEVVLLIEALDAVAGDPTQSRSEAGRIQITTDERILSAAPIPQGSDGLAYDSIEPIQHKPMPDYHANILSLLELDVDSLPTERRARMADELVQILNARVLEDAYETLNQHQTSELDVLLDDDEHPENAIIYLEKNVPNLKGIQLKNIAKLKNELAQSRTQIEDKLRREYEDKLRQARESAGDNG